MKHNSAAAIRSIPPIRLAFTAISIVCSIVFAFAAFGAIGTSITYQGQLRRSGAAYNGTCNFQFSLWNAETGGVQVGTTQSLFGANVANGLFTVALDFGPNAFEGPYQWLQTAVQCSGDGGFTQLDPRQLITPAPYALNLRPGTHIAADNNITAFSATGGTGVQGLSSGVNGSGVEGQGPTGVLGISTFNNGIGVNGNGNGPFGAGVFGFNNSGAGVWGKSTGGGGSGVYGESSTGRGVSGNATGNSSTAGVYGENTNGAGVWGKSLGNGSAVYGENSAGGYAGRFVGPVSVQGTLTKSAGTFKIDHPLDPANKFLSHSFVESPEMMNIYNGNVVTDATGSATVTLPAYFCALNRDYRYQLTVLGQFAQAIVSREIIADNTFAIRTDKPGVKVSWQVTGVRQDAYAKENPIVVEQAKSAAEQGKYLYPAGYGAGEEQRIGYSPAPAPTADAAVEEAGNSTGN